MRIMYCHNGTESAQRSLESAVGFFKGMKPELVLVCVAEDVLDASLEGEAITEEYKSEQSAVMRKAAEWVAGQGLEVNVLLATGDPRKMMRK